MGPFERSIPSKQASKDDSHAFRREIWQSGHPTVRWQCLLLGVKRTSRVQSTSSDFCLYTYVPVLGGVTATVALMAYYSRVVSPSSAKISWKLLLLGFLPYLFLTYVVVYFGLYAIYRGVIVSFSVWTILAGTFWVAFGYRGIDQFYLMTEIVKQHSKIHLAVR